MYGNENSGMCRKATCHISLKYRRKLSLIECEIWNSRLSLSSGNNGHQRDILLNTEMLGPFCSQLGYYIWSNGWAEAILLTSPLSANGEVPELDGLVVAAWDDDKVAEAEAGDAVRVRAQGDQPLRVRVSSSSARCLCRLSFLSVTPDLDRLVVRGGHDPPPVRLQATNHTCWRCNKLALDLWLWKLWLCL